METVAPRSVTLRRESEGVYIARNPEGAEVRFGNAPDALGNVELLLAALAGCSGTDLDVMTSRRAEPTEWSATVTADKVTADGANILRDIVVTFHVEFPEGADGDKARARIEPALKAAHEKSCTVSRTIEHGATVTLRGPSSDCA
jgi:putative redox protein